MTIAEALRQGQNRLRQVGIESARIDTSLLLEKVTGQPRSWLLAHADAELQDDQASSFFELINRREQRVPLVHLTNTREFYGLDFYIDERVLTPRVETERMVELAIKQTPPGSTLLDMGTGSGAMAIAIAKHRPDLKITASEVSREALEVAHINAKRHQVAITLIESDLLQNVRGRFSTVIANLPYLRNDALLMPEVTKEPVVALLGGPDGLDLYRRLFQSLPQYLQPKAWVFTECDPWQQADLKQLAATAHLEPRIEDYFILGFRFTG